jgi:hypothetical protein
MVIELPLARWDEAERLKTAVYRFAELNRAAAPVVAVRDKAGRPSCAVAFATETAADEFRLYWRRFQAEPLGWGGFRDV